MNGICPECGHSIDNHHGIIDMGGGHSEPVGCLTSIGPLKDDICDCMAYQFDEGDLL